MTWVDDFLVLLAEAQAPIPKTYGTDVFRGTNATIPTGEGPYLSIIEILGAAPDDTHNAAAQRFPAYVRPSAQLLFRSTVYDIAREAADATWLFLQPVRDRFINGTWWRNIGVSPNVTDLPVDKEGRARVQFTIDITKRLSSFTS